MGSLSSSSYVEVHVVILAFQGDRWVRPCIASLASAQPARLAITVVDNGRSTDLSAISWGNLEHEVLSVSEPLGFAAANNHALVRGRFRGRFTAFLNQDTVSPGDWLTPCIDLMQSRPDIGALTPMTRSYDGQGWDPYFLECARQSAAFTRDFAAGQPLAAFYATEVIPAAAMVVRSDVLRAVGPFDPIYGSYYEDYDLCRRIREAGYRVGVCSGGTVCHFSGSATNTEAAERRRARWITRNRVIERQRSCDGNRFMSWLAYWLAGFPRGLARSLLRRPGAKPLGPYLAAHWDLVRLTPRLVSAAQDGRAWRCYLAEIGWPPSGPAMAMHAKESIAQPAP